MSAVFIAGAGWDGPLACEPPTCYDCRLDGQKAGRPRIGQGVEPLKLGEAAHVARAKGAHSIWIPVAVVIAGGLIWHRFGDSILAHFDGSNAAQSEAVRAAERDYEIARRNGTDADRCRAADAVVAAHLRGGNTQDLERWQRIRADDCIER